MFIGRQGELKQLEDHYKPGKSQIIVIYGRRRIGKSALVEKFIHDKPYLKFEGVEGENTPDQIQQFTKDLAKQIPDNLLKNVKFNDWNEIFDYLTEYFNRQKRKVVLFLDEFQWLAANQSKLVSLIKKYWDNKWQHQKVFLVLCGSVSSFMVKRVIKSSALYGRIDMELCLGPLSPKDSFELLHSKRSIEETFKYLLILGGIPKYLELVQTNQSLEQNLNTLCFMQNSYFSQEYERIFYSQFREYHSYERIINYLADSPKSLEEISKKLNLKSSGGVARTTNNPSFLLRQRPRGPFIAPADVNKQYVN